MSRPIKFIPDTDYCRVLVDGQLSMLLYPDGTIRNKNGARFKAEGDTYLVATSVVANIDIPVAQLPSWATEYDIDYYNLSSNGTGWQQMQLGVEGVNGGALITSGYTGGLALIYGSGQVVNSAVSLGMAIGVGGSAANTSSGNVRLKKVKLGATSYLWEAVINETTVNGAGTGNSSILVTSPTGNLTAMRFNMTVGTELFDLGGFITVTPRG